MSPKVFRQVAVLGVGIVIRVLLVTMLTDVGVDYLTQRVEVMSPLTAYSRLVEGRHLVANGMNPYMGEFFKLNPVIASLLFPLMGSTTVLFSWLVAMDTLSAAMLMVVAGDQWAMAVGWFFFNPYTIVNALGLSAQSLHVLVTALTLYAVVHKRSVLLATLALSLLIVLKPVSPVILILPIAACLGQSVWRVTGYTLAWTLLLHSFSMHITNGSVDYVYSSLWAPLLITPDLEPNLGFAWALFSVVFPDSLPLFRLLFHGLLLVLSVPVFMRFSRGGYLLDTKERYLALMTGAMLLFQPYPTGIDFALLMSLLLSGEPRFIDKLAMMTSQFILAGLAFSSAMATLWLERNTANMNFSFSMTMIIPFCGLVAIGQGLKLARLDRYVPPEARAKKDE